MASARQLWSRVKEVRDLSMLLRTQFNWLAMWFRLGRRDGKEGGGGRLRGVLEAFKGPEILKKGK